MTGDQKDADSGSEWIETLAARQARGQGVPRRRHVDLRLRARLPYDVRALPVPHLPAWSVERASDPRVLHLGARPSSDGDAAGCLPTGRGGGHPDPESVARRAALDRANHRPLGRLLWDAGVDERPQHRLRRRRVTADLATLPLLGPLYHRFGGAADRGRRPDVG